MTDLTLRSPTIPGRFTEPLPAVTKLTNKAETEAKSGTGPSLQLHIVTAISSEDSFTEREEFGQVSSSLDYINSKLTELLINLNCPNCPLRDRLAYRAWP